VLVVSKSVRKTKPWKCAVVKAVPIHCCCWQ